MNFLLETTSPENSTQTWKWVFRFICLTDVWLKHMGKQEIGMEISVYWFPKPIIWNYRFPTPAIKQYLRWRLIIWKFDSGIEMGFQKYEKFSFSKHPLKEDIVGFYFKLNWWIWENLYWHNFCGSKDGNLGWCVQKFLLNFKNVNFHYMKK